MDFIPWIQTSENAPYYYNGVRNADGTVPTVWATNSPSHANKLANAIKFAEAANASINAPLPPGLQEVQQNIAGVFHSPEKLSAVANNMYQAHKQFIGKQSRKRICDGGKAADALYR